MATLKEINSKIKLNGYDAELVKGERYFYFIGPAVQQCHSTSVYVSKLNQLSPDKWIEELAHMIRIGY